MAALDKESGLQSKAPHPTPANDWQDESEEMKGATPEPGGSKDPDGDTPTKKRTIRRKVEQTKSALRRRTSSNPNVMRRFPRRLRFEEQEEDGQASSEKEIDRPERRDDFVEQLEKWLPAKLSFKQRMKHFTWTWFTMTMATGGIANVLYSVPNNLRFGALYGLGCAFFLLNIALFIFNVIMISIRFYLHPHTFRQSFLHPTESLFIPAAIISFGTILINITQYGADYTGDWLNQAVVPLFWMYCGMAVVSSWGIFLIIWSTQTFTIAKMTPVWIFPAYPLLICGPHAANLTKKLGPEQGLPIIVGGFILQGIGFMVSLMVYSAFLYRLMTQKLPKESLRPAMFISVGPSGFTITAFIQMGQQLPRLVHKDFMGKDMGIFVGRVTMILANWAGIWLWGLAIWLFLVSVGAHYSCATRGRLDFAMTWYSFVFPNTALTTSTFAMSYALHGDLTEAKEFSAGARPFQILGCIMTIALVMLWFFVFGMMIRAVIMKQILWPQKQEDRDEGGWGKDEVVRKGELKSLTDTPRASEAGGHPICGDERHIVAQRKGEGLAQGIALDLEDIEKAASRADSGSKPAKRSVDIEGGQQEKIRSIEEDDQGLYMTTSRRATQRAQPEEHRKKGKEAA